MQNRVNNLYMFSIRSALMTGAIDETEKRGNRNWYVFDQSSIWT
jgi:hypothetical protein